MRAGLWILFLTLLLGVGLLLVPACGLLPWGIDACSQPALPGPLAQAAERRDALHRMREDLARSVNLAEQCRIHATAVEEGAAACQPVAAKEVVVLVDVSRSMKWDLAADPAILRRLHELDAASANTQNPLASLAQQMEYTTLLDRLEAGPGEDRIDVARRALTKLGREVSDGTELTLLSFAECGRPPVENGTFTIPTDRGDFDTAVAALSLRSDTALAEAIGALPDHTHAGRSPDRTLNILILSDGEDNCGGDPCAAVASLRSSLPYATVSVISMADAASSNACIAEVAGGYFYRAVDMDDLTRRLRQATGLLTAEECATPPDDPAAQETRE